MFYKIYYRLNHNRRFLWEVGREGRDFKITYPYVQLSQFHNAVFKKYIPLLL